MLNHKRPKRSVWGFDDKLGGFKLESFDKLYANTELYDSYGRKSNHRFFINYGFLEDDNDANCCYLWDGLNSDISEFSLKGPLFKMAIKKFDIEKEAPRFILDRDFEENVDEYLSFLRIKFCKDISFIKKLIEVKFFYCRMRKIER